MRLFKTPLVALVALLPACDQLPLDSTTGAESAALTAETAPLTAAQEAGLLRLREEEKLARDVYRTLGAQWELPIFVHIERSEQRHMDRVGDLLWTYGLEDPVPGNGTGTCDGSGVIG